MTSEEVLSRMTSIFRDVLDNPEIVLAPETSAADIEEWDSLSHISLIVATEKEFKLKFDLLDLKPLSNIGDMVALIQRKTQ